MNVLTMHEMNQVGGAGDAAAAIQQQLRAQAAAQAAKNRARLLAARAVQSTLPATNRPTVMAPLRPLPFQQG